MAAGRKRLRPRQKLAHYRIVRYLASGGYAEVYHAVDTILGIPCALKLPHPHLIDDESLDDFRREVRISARLDHPNIMPIFSAFFVDGRFVVVSPLGEGTLSDRLESRLPARTALDFTAQILEALAFAHQRKIIHCDVTPDNFILFPGDRLKLTDFGLARTMFRTLNGSGRGTVGYLAPEQAMGKPSFRSDLFSAGLIAYRMFAGVLPEWPYEWPPSGSDRLRKKVSPPMIALLRRMLEVDARKRFADAGVALAAFRRIRNRALSPGTRRKKRISKQGDWRMIRLREFRRRFGALLETGHPCPRCGAPVSEPMRACPWCGAKRKTHRGEHRFPARCPRCRRGVKLDWTYCPWCYGGKIGPASNRCYTDRRYSGRCANPGCVEKDLMPFMRYCPWCRRKVKRPWRIEGIREKCPRCSWGALKEYWRYCPWCTHRLRR